LKAVREDASVGEEIMRLPIRGTERQGGVVAGPTSTLEYRKKLGGGGP